MKNVNIEISFKGKVLKAGIYNSFNCDVDNDVDFSLLDNNGQPDVLNSQEYIKAENTIYNLDIFKNVKLPVSELTSKDSFKITIIDNGNTYKTKFRCFRKYNEKLYFDNDLYIYGESIFVKEEFLNLSKFANLQACFKPNYSFFGNSPMYYGFELEISCGNETNFNYLYKSLIQKDLLKGNKVILKNDSSIRGDYCVEIVTAPHGRKEINDLVNELFSIFKGFQSGAKGHNMGGMHVHCSLAPLSAKNILNLVIFMFNQNNTVEFNKIAQRSCVEYAAFNIDRVFNQQELLDFVTGHTKKIKNSNRYSAINFTDNTVEFRIFNSSLRDDRILKNLDFVEACLSFIKNKSFSKDFEAFRKFVLNNSRKYKHLKGYIQYSNEE